jgi:peptidoglycan/xylan/chitin deacetylase (PgdA/CDA1 family)
MPSMQRRPLRYHRRVPVERSRALGAASAARSSLGRVIIRASRVRSELDHSTASVALTFDDGPDPVHTPQVLDVLAELGAAATFFVVGERAVRHPELIRRMIEEGHGVGSHSFTHPDPWTVPLTARYREYRAGRRAVEEIVGSRIPLFRPPKGHVDRNGALAMCAARLEPWLWTTDSRDWVPGASRHQIAANAVQLRAGNIVLLHDGIAEPAPNCAKDRSETTAALPMIVASARAQELSLVSLPPR